MSAYWRFSARWFALGQWTATAIPPISRAGAALDPRRTPDPYGGALAGLAAACGLGFRLS